MTRDVRLIPPDVEQLRALAAFWLRYQSAPTEADIIKRVTTTGAEPESVRSSVRKRFAKLKAGGFIEHAGGRERGFWKLTPKGHDLLAAKDEDAAAKGGEA